MYVCLCLMYMSICRHTLAVFRFLIIMIFIFFFIIVPNPNLNLSPRGQKYTRQCLTKILEASRVQQFLKVARMSVLSFISPRGCGARRCWGGGSAGGGLQEGVGQAGGGMGRRVIAGAGKRCMELQFD